MLFSFNVFAACSDFSARGLTDEQTQQIRVNCEQMRLETVKSAKSVITGSDISRDDVSAWAGIAKEFGQALGVAAKEVGISVNEFMQTPAGYLAVALIVWSMAGNHIIALVLILLLTWLFIFINKRLWFSHAEYVEKSFLGFKWNKKVNHYLTYRNMVDTSIFISVVSVMILCGSVALIFANIN